MKKKVDKTINPLMYNLSTNGRIKNISIEDSRFRQLPKPGNDFWGGTLINISKKREKIHAHPRKLASVCLFVKRNVNC